MKLSHGLHAALNNRTMVILDALATVCAQKKPSVVAIGLRLAKPIELLSATNDKSFPNAVVSQLNTICKIVKKISDHKYNYGFPSVDINKSSLPSSYDNTEVKEFYGNLLFQIFSYSWETLRPKPYKSWAVNQKFRGQLSKRAPARGAKKDKDDPDNMFIYKVEEFNAIFPGH